MRQNQEEQIEAYLNGSMSKQEELAFEQEMQLDPELALSVEIERDLMAFYNDGTRELKATLQAIREEEAAIPAPINQPPNAPERAKKAKSAKNRRLIIIGVIAAVLSLVTLAILLRPASTPSDHRSSDGNASDTNPTEMPVAPNVEVDSSFQNEATPSDDNIQNDQNSNTADRPIANTVPTNVTDNPTANPLAFAENPMLERMVTSDYRASDQAFEVTKPISERLVVSNPSAQIHLKMRAKASEYSSIKLLICTNRPSDLNEGRFVLDTTLVSRTLNDGSYSFRFNAMVNLPKGLYYYIIRHEGKTLFVNKFRVEDAE